MYKNLKNCWTKVIIYGIINLKNGSEVIVMAQIATRVSDDEKRELEQYCKDRDIKISQLIRWAIKDYLDKNKEEQNKE